MARIARIEYLYDGCYIHLISRSIRKIKIFSDNEDFQTFFDLIKEAKKSASFKLYHYCIMQTHFHMAVKVGNIQKFSKAIQYVKSQYDLPPKKWTQRRVGDSMKTDLKQEVSNGRREWEKEAV